MSKFLKLFKKFGKKKDPEVQDEEFYSDVESNELGEDQDSFEDDLLDNNQDSDALEDYEELGEETVLLNTEIMGEELLPHEHNGKNAQVPTDSDLAFPKVPQEDQTSPPISDLMSLNSKSEENLSGFLNDDATKEINLDDFNNSLEEELSEDSLDETPSFSEMKINRDESEEEDDEDLAESSNQTGTSEILELDDADLSIKDKLSHAFMRAGDRFRNLKTKKLNSSFDGEEESNLKKSTKVSFDKFKKRASSINWANLPKEIFARQNRGKLHKYFQLSFTLILVYSVSNLVGSGLIEKKDYKALENQKLLSFSAVDQLDKQKIDQIKAANLLKTEQIKAEKAPEKKDYNTDQLCKTATIKSGQNIKLVNTIILQDSVKSIASVQVRSKELLKVRQGDKIANGNLKIDKIERLKLIVKNLTNGDCEYIENVDKKTKKRKIFKTFSKSASSTYKKKKASLKGIKTDGTNFNIDKKFLKSKMSDISAILTQAKGTPIYNADGTLSFAISQVDPEGVFAYLGIENGDVITEINGQPIKELNEVMKLFGRIGNIDKLNLTVSRNGQQTPLNYNIE